MSNVINSNQPQYYYSYGREGGTFVLKGENTQLKIEGLKDNPPPIQDEFKSFEMTKDKVTISLQVDKREIYSKNSNKPTQETYIKEGKVITDIIGFKVNQRGRISVMLGPRAERELRERGENIAKRVVESFEKALGGDENQNQTEIRENKNNVASTPEEDRKFKVEVDPKFEIRKSGVEAGANAKVKINEHEAKLKFRVTTDNRIKGVISSPTTGTTVSAEYQKKDDKEAARFTVYQKLPEEKGRVSVEYRTEKNPQGNEQQIKFEGSYNVSEGVKLGANALVRDKGNKREYTAGVSAEGTTTIKDKPVQFFIGTQYGSKTENRQVQASFNVLF